MYDSRFSPITRDEWPRLTVSVSILVVIILILFFQFMYNLFRAHFFRRNSKRLAVIWIGPLECMAFELNSTMKTVRNGRLLICHKSRKNKVCVCFCTFQQNFNLFLFLFRLGSQSDHWFVVAQGWLSWTHHAGCA